MTNQVLFGDNLPLLRQYIKDESIDLIYLDPPFNSKANYNVIFKGPNNKESSSSQITAFEDTWHWHTGETEFEFNQLKKGDGAIAEVMKGLELVIGKNDLLAYLTMMAIRLRELHRVLKDTGSLYLHCDPTASHYLKIILDSIFGVLRFRNEIIWKRNPSHEDSNGFGNVSDTILFYGDKINKDAVREPLDDETKKFYNYSDSRGYYRPENLKSTGLRGGGYTYEYHGHLGPWRCPKSTMLRYEQEERIHFPKKDGGVPQRKRYLNDHPGIVPTNIWTDIKKARGNERIGYPTQKPLALLERIIKASSNEGDIILDPFCGCGTAIVAAQKLNRKWVGMDKSQIAVDMTKNRINLNSTAICPKYVCEVKK